MTLEPLENGAYRCLEDPGEPGYDGLPRRISVTAHEAQVLRAMAAGRAVVEIGTGLGVSARAMATTAMRLTTIDNDPWVQTRIWPTLPARVRTLAHTGAACWPADLVFIDGLHTAAALEIDIREAVRLLDRRTASAVLFHDIELAVVRDTILRYWSRIVPICPNLGWVLTEDYRA